MASSNRHWPSMFKSKPPCNNQWQHHDINSSLIHKTPYNNNNQVTGSCEERTPEPKPRWNPRPEQIRILESIFNSGMVNPPRDEIRKIRVQLQEYGQVGDANVFYWFQNRKSRSKHKQRLIQTTKSASTQATPTPPLPVAPVVTTVTSTTSSTSSNKSSSSPNSAEKSISVGSNVGSTTNVMMDLLSSPTGSVNQPFFTSGPTEFLPEPFFFPVQKNDVLGQGFCFPNDEQNVEHCSLLSELMLMSGNGVEKKDDNDGKMKLQTQVGYGGSNAVDCNVGLSSIVPQSSSSLPVPNPTNFIFQGVPEMGPIKSTVFINDVCFEVGVGPFNVREAFGDDAVLLHSSGQPVLVNEWGLTLMPLQHGAFYYLVRASPDLRTIDLI